MEIERRLAAILAADVAGYARLMAAEEVATLRALTTRRATMDELIARHRGRIVGTAGDSVLAEFASVVDAVACALAVQAAMATADADEPAEHRMRFRIGVNLGDVLVKGTDIFGDGVNIAARLEALAEPGGVCVSGTVHDRVAGKLAADFTDLGEQRVKNIARPVRAYRVASRTPTPAAPSAAAPRPSLPLPDKPSPVALPFQNMSGDAEQDYFADGMTEEITTALSRIRQFFVIARNTAFTCKGKQLDLKQVGRELGVRYLLEGSVRKAGDRIRITGQLIDAENGAHLWADRFDSVLEDVFDLQDRVTTSVVGAIEPSIARALTLNPNSAIALGGGALVRRNVRDYATAIDQATRALRLSPYDVMAPPFRSGRDGVRQALAPERCPRSPAAEREISSEEICCHDTRAGEVAVGGPEIRVRAPRRHRSMRIGGPATAS